MTNERSVSRILRPSICLFSFTILLAAGCSTKSLENPFGYSFIRTLHLKRQPQKPYSEYRAFYLLTEDFEPSVDSATELERMNDVLQFAAGLSRKYSIPWTHFIDVNSLAPAFISDKPELKQRSQAMICYLAGMVEGGDDCELHLHGPLIRELLDYVREQQKIHIKGAGEEEFQVYRQRKSFFFNSFYRQGYRKLVSSLIYGKSLLERTIYDGKKKILAFRPGGWDHGSSELDTLLYFHALADAGLIANSGLSTGEFGSQSWRVGNNPGKNLGLVSAGDDRILEVSPTTGPGGYINPALTTDINALVNSDRNEMTVIVSVYHLSSLQSARITLESERTDDVLQAERDAIEQHFKTVAYLAAAKIVYPINLRDLIEVINEQR